MYQIPDQNRESAAMHLFEFRPACMPIGGALEHAGDAQQLLLLERCGEDLQAHRQPHKQAGANLPTASLSRKTTDEPECGP